MAFTSPPTMTNGVSNFDKADLNTYLRDNLAEIRDRPVVKVDADVFTSTSGIQHSLDLIDTNTEFDAPGGRHTGGNNWFDLYAAAGEEIWYVGATGKWEANNTGGRRLRMYDSTSGTVNDIIAEYKIPGPGQVARSSIATAYAFDATDRDVITSIYQDSGSSLDDFGTQWAMLVGAQSRPSAGNPFRGDLTLGQTTGATVWWNDVVRDCVLRLRSRPFARTYRTTSTTLTDATWTTFPFNVIQTDNTGFGTDPTRFVCPTDFGGFYYVCATIGISGFTAASSRLRARFQINGTSTRWIAATPNASAGNAYVCVQGVLQLAAGDEVTLQVRQDSGASRTTIGGVGTHMAIAALSITDQTVPDRQFFTDGVLPPEIDFTDLSGDYIYPGTVNVYGRDTLLHLWNPPVIGGFAETDEETIGSGSWEDVGCGLSLYNSWSEDTLPRSTWLGSNRLALPHDGVWLVVAQCHMDAQGVGDEGNRGVKIRHGGFHESPIRTASMNASGHDWQACTSALINGRAGEEVWLQALQNRSDGDDLTIQNAAVVAAWVRPYIA